MYQCPTCGAPISPTAPICFNCGETGYSGGEGGCGLLLVVMGVVAAALCCGVF